MGLFEKKKKPEKNKSTTFYIDVEEITKDEFDRLKQWVKENISSTERYTPEWKTSDGSIVSGFSLLGAPAMNDIMEKVRFRFKHEEDAMAFKLIL